MKKRNRGKQWLAAMLCFVLLMNNTAVYGVYGTETGVGSGSEEWVMEGLETEDPETEEPVDVEDSSADPSQNQVTSEETEESDSTDEITDTGEETLETDGNLFTSVEEEMAEPDLQDTSVPVYNKALDPQDIYWQDNNVGTAGGRLSADEYKEWFLTNGKVKIAYQVTDDKGNTETKTTFVKISSLNVNQDKVTVEDQGGTGHYLLKFTAGAFPGVYADGALDKDGKPCSYTVSHISLVTPDPTVDSDIPDFDRYVFKDIPDEATRNEYTTNKNVGLGWYYLKKYDFKIHIEVRRGDMEYKSGLDTAILKELVFCYLKKSANPEFSEIGIEEIQNQYEKSIITENREGNKLVSMDITIPNIAQYRIDGTERTYHIEEAKTSRNNKVDADPDFSLGDGDYFSISYDNSSAPNFGTETDAAYAGGTIILTRKGTTTYNATKVWQDSADSSQRPSATFTLWRYSKRGQNVDYKQASQVSNDNGERLQITIPAGSSKDSYSLDFSYGSEFRGSDGNVLLAENETLSKYDPEGYEYVYFVKEQMGQSFNSYEKIFGKIENTESGNVITDTLPDQTENDHYKDGDVREATDSSLYNGGTLNNTLKGSKTTKLTKRWKAAAYQSEFNDSIKAEFTLQKKHTVSQGEENNLNFYDDWSDAKDSDGNVIKKVLSGFREETMTMTVSSTVPKYDEMGHELEYRWVESNVIQEGYDTRFRRNEDGTAFFVLYQDGQPVQYTSIQEPEDPNNPQSTTVIVNQLVNKVNYEVTKQWLDSEENDISDQMAGKKITFVLYRQASNQTSPEKLLTGTADGYADESASTDEATGIVYQEKEPWKASFTNLPRYDSEGHRYDYTVLEQEYEGYSIIYQDPVFDKDTQTYKRKIVNQPRSGQMNYIYVRKQWVDDSDLLHRGPVVFTLYQKNGGSWKELDLDGQGNGKVTLTETGFWQKQVVLPDGVTEDQILVLETGATGTDGKVYQVPSIDGDGNAHPQYTDEEMKEIYNVQHPAEGQTASTPEMYYSTDEHQYLATYSVDMQEGISFYTVTDQRLGKINLTVTKSWTDGSEGQDVSAVRKELAEQLSDHNIGLYVILRCDDSDTAVDYIHSTIDIGTGARHIFDKNGNQVKAYQKITIDTLQAGNREELYFFSLPKYDKTGRVVHYSAEEVYLKENSDGTLATDVNGKPVTVKLSDYGIQTEYNVSAKNKYTVGDHHSEDTQDYELTNKLSGTKKIRFHKQWLDAYRYRRGERPDIYLDLYRQVHYRNDDGKIATKIDNIYVDYLWTHADAEEEYDWTVTMSGLPKYDDLGYEIIYYAQEKMHVDATKFDYKPVYYKYNSAYDTAALNDEDKEDNEGEGLAASDSLVVIGDTTGYEEGIDKTSGLLASVEKDGKQIWLLRENGIFVNQLEATISLEGKKVWGNLPRGYDSRSLPEATFMIYQKTLSSGEISENTSSDTPYAKITISDWDSQYIDSEYKFLLEYSGTNTNTAVTDAQTGAKALTAQGEERSERIPMYDGNGNRYSYTLKEVVNTKAPDGAKVYLEPLVNNMMVENYYSSDKGYLTVKKILDVEKEESETYPSVTFSLIRYYTGKDSEGNDVLKRDYSFRDSLTIDHSSFKLMEGETGFASAQGTFDDLEIYAPNGEKFLYKITEQTIAGQKESYSLEFAKPGNCDKNGNLIQGAEGSQPDTAVGSTADAWVEGLYASKDKDTPDATFQNQISPKLITISGIKTWTDSSNVLGLRPSVDKVSDSIRFKVLRYADAQPSASNGVGSAGHLLTVDSSNYQISWSQKQGQENQYAFLITGNNGELEKYAPNGMPWHYYVQEEIIPESEGGTGLPGYVIPSGAQLCKADASGNLFTVSVENKQTEKTQLRIVKNWKNSDNSTWTDYLGYQTEIQFRLQAQIVGKYNGFGTQISQAGEWMNVCDLFLDDTNGLSRTQDEYYNIWNAPFTSENWVRRGFALALDKSSDVTFRFKGYVKNAYAWKATMSNLPKYIGEKGTDNYYVLQYRAVEYKVIYYKANGTKLAEHQIHQSQPDNLVTDASKNIGYTGLTPGDYLYTDIKGMNTYTGGNSNISTWTNAFPVTSLSLKKIWEDTSDAYGTRKTANNQWFVKFVIQRSVKDQDTWEDVNSWNASGKATRTIVELKGSDSSGAADINEKEMVVSGLPLYGLDANGNVVEYKYRARELNTDSSQTVITENGRYYNGSSSHGGIYQVEYTDSKESDGSYRTVTRNSYTATQRYASKVWDLPEPFTATGEDGKTGWTYPVTLELKYKDIQGNLKSFEKPAKVVLDSTKDIEKDLSTLAPAYGEYDSWKAIWKGIPDYMPGSQTQVVNGSEKTIYYIEEIQTGFYQDKAYDVAGETEAAPVVFTNMPTELQVSKEVDLGDTTEFNLDDREFTFKLTASGVTGEYWSVTSTTDDQGRETSEAPVKITLGGTFKLKKNQTIRIYGLPVYQTGTKSQAIYRVTETESGAGGVAGTGFVTKFDTKVKISFSKGSDTVTDGNNTNNGQGTAYGDVGFGANQPEAGKEPEIAFTNILEGTIHLVKTDGAGNTLSGAEFTIKYRKKESSQGTAFMPLDDSVCSNLAGNSKDSANPGVKVTGRDGQVDFTDLKLGYEYEITETKPPEGAYGLETSLIVEIPKLLSAEVSQDGTIRPAASDEQGRNVFTELKYVIANNKVSMPVTGKKDFFWPGYLGLFLVGAGCMFWVWEEKRKKNKEVDVK